MSLLSHHAGPSLPTGFSEVHAHDRVVRFRSLGVGPIVLLLGAGDDFWPELPVRLEPHLRIVVPELSQNAPDDVVHSTHSLLEGIGASGVGVIGGGQLVSEAMELALSAPDYVSRIVLVSDDAAPAFVFSGRNELPLLVLHRRLAVDRAVALILPFLQAGVAR